MDGNQINGGGNFKPAHFTPTPKTGTGDGELKPATFNNGNHIEHPVKYDTGHADRIRTMKRSLADMLMDPNSNPNDIRRLDMQIDRETEKFANDTGHKSHDEKFLEWFRKITE